MSESKRISLACIADDDTGATDAADMIAQSGTSTVVFIGVPSPQVLAKYCRPNDAVVIAAGTRALDSDQAVHIIEKGISRLKALNPQMYQFKICSTFDSTRNGNIGQSTEVAMDAIGADLVPMIPALPVNGRTTYMGHQFVEEMILSESPLKDHPLNPMSDSNLVRWLQYQTKYRVGLLSLSVVRQGVCAIKKQLHALGNSGYKMVIVDAIEKWDLVVIAQAIEDYSLIVGSSGISGEIVRRLACSKDNTCPYDLSCPVDHDVVLAVAGSCSQRTRMQNQYALDHGINGIRVEAKRILDSPNGAYQKQIIELAVKSVSSGVNTLVYTSDDLEGTQSAISEGKSLGMNTQQVGSAISRFLAEITKSIVQHTHIRRLIVAGGETASMLCRTLELVALRVKSRVEPGIPLCIAQGKTNLAVVLKSGGFGSDMFYLIASQKLQEVEVRPDSRSYLVKNEIL